MTNFAHRGLGARAQGVDFELVAAAPAAALSRIQSIQMEMWRDTRTCRVHRTAMYRGDQLNTTCSHMVGHMSRIGFRLAGYTAVLPKASRGRGRGPGKDLYLVNESACGSSRAISWSLCEWNALFVNTRGRFPELRDDELILLPPT